MRRQLGSVLLAFFMPQSSRPIWEVGGDATADPNMVPIGPLPTEAPAPTEWQLALQEHKTDLLSCFTQLEAMISDKVMALLAPLTTQIQEVKSTLNEVAQTADSAMELGLAAQDSNRLTQQHSEWVTKRIKHLENQLRVCNVKLRGFREGAEGDSDLPAFVSRWMAAVLQ